MREVLCLAYSCPPILDPQSILLAKMLGPLRRRGFRFRVIGLDPSSCLAATDASLVQLLPPEPEPVRIPASEKRLWFRAMARYLPSLLRMPDKHLPAHFRSVRAAKALHAAEPAHLLFSWAQYHSCSIAALRLKKSLHLPWVAHFSDPWMGHPYQRVPWWQARINGWLEEAVIKAADALVFVSEETREWTMSRYPGNLRPKAEVIPHCFEPSLYPCSASRRSGLVFRHLGHFYGERRAQPLLRALAMLRDEDPRGLVDVHVEFLGRVRSEEAAEVSRLHLEDLVRLRGTVGYRESLREMEEADVLLLVEAPASTNLFLPSKLIDYLGAGPPVLALTPNRGPAASLLTGPGDRVISPDDVPGIAAALKAYIQTFRKKELSGLRRNRGALARFECESTMASLSSVFERVLGR